MCEEKVELVEAKEWDGGGVGRRGSGWKEEKKMCLYWHISASRSDKWSKVVGEAHSLILQTH